MKTRFLEIVSEIRKMKSTIIHIIYIHICMYIYLCDLYDICIYHLCMYRDYGQSEHVRLFAQPEHVPFARITQTRIVAITSHRHDSVWGCARTKERLRVVRTNGRVRVAHISH